MNILVTGGAGFIGQKVAKFLNNKNIVDIIDFADKITESMTSSFNCYGYDISSSEWINQLNKEYDIIIHCAAQTGGYYSLIDPITDCKWNSMGTINVIEFAKKCRNLKKIIYTSSMSVYGEGIEKNEQDNLDPISYYGVSKLSGEFYTKLCWHHLNIPYTILRLWNTYGSGQDLDNKHQGMLSIYLSQALSGDTVEIKGHPDRIRDHIHVDDVVSAISLCINNRETDNQIFNVCTGISSTSTEVIEELAKQLNKDLRIVEIEGYAGDQNFSAGSNNKLRELGWKSNKALKDGISEFLNNTQRQK